MNRINHAIFGNTNRRSASQDLTAARARELQLINEQRQRLGTGVNEQVDAPIIIPDTQQDQLSVAGILQDQPSDLGLGTSQYNQCHCQGKQQQATTTFLTFFHDSHTNDLEDWIYEMERYFRKSQMNQAEKTDFASDYLRGNASREYGKTRKRCRQN